VIGGGVAGTSVALHLARRGVRACVLEAGEVAGRASGRNDGQMLLGLGEHHNRIASQWGIDRALELWGFIRENNRLLKEEIVRSGIACDLVDEGGLRLADSASEQDELRETAALLREHGLPHRLLEEDEVRALLPGVGFCGGLILPGEALVQPVAMVRGLATLAIAAGAAVCEGRPVARIEGDRGAFELVLADGARVRSAVVVHATSVLAPTLDRSGFIGRKVFPFRGQIAATDPLPDDLARAFPARPMSSHFCYEYFRVHRRRFVIGGMRWSVRGEEQGTLDDGTVNPEVGANLRAYARSHFPQLQGVEFPHEWTGIMAGTPDGLPLVGEIPGRTGELCCMAFNGYGLSFAYLAGSVVADLVVAGRSATPGTRLFAPRRFV
jgi:sarcosine oxidase